MAPHQKHHRIKTSLVKHPSGEMLKFSVGRPDQSKILLDIPHLDWVLDPASSDADNTRVLLLPYQAKQMKILLAGVRGKGLWIELPKDRLQTRTRKVAQKRSELSADLLARIEQFKQHMEQRRYSHHTVSSYVSMIKQFYGRVDMVDWTAVTHEVIEDYNHKHFIQSKRSHSSQNQFINAIKLFCD